MESVTSAPQPVHPLPSVEMLDPQDASEHRGTKRKCLELDRNPSKSPALHETLTPQVDSRYSTPDSLLHHNGVRDQDIEFFKDECHDNYEWIRVPKKRDFDLFKVARREPEDRDSAELPLVARRLHDGKDVTMWAKMDTGADANAINRSTLEALLGDSMEKFQRSITLDESKDFTLLGDNHFKATHYVVLDLYAGRSKTKFEKVRFVVIPDDWQDPNGDGIPNVILGYPFLREKSMVMIDVEYHHDADSELEVIADKAENEKAGASCILITKFSQTKGMVPPSTGRPIRR